MALLIFIIYLLSLAVSASAFAISVLATFISDKNVNKTLSLLPLVAAGGAVFGLMHHLSMPKGYIIQWTDPEAFDPSNTLTAIFSLLLSIATLLIILRTDFGITKSAKARKAAEIAAVAAEASIDLEPEADKQAPESAVPSETEPEESASDPQEVFAKVKEQFGLTDRESELCSLICEGKSNPDIAKELFISENTVKTHIYNLFKKTGVSSRIELVTLIAGSTDHPVLSGK